MTAKKTGTKSAQVSAEKNSEIRKKVGGITVESALTAVSTAQAAIGKTLASVGEQVQKELQTLDTINKANELAREEGERIHGAAAIALSIEEAQAAAEAKKDELDRAVEAHTILLADRKFAAERQFSAETNARTEQQARLNGQWTYEFELRKRDAASAFQEEQRLARVAEQVRKESLEKDWANREEGLKKQETEIVELRAKVVAFPDDLNKAVSKAEAIVGNSMKRDKEHEIQILVGAQNAARVVFENTIENLKRELTNKDKLINDLSTQLIAANTKVETIATKALDAAANRQALADLQAVNQSTNNGTRKTS